MKRVYVAGSYNGPNVIEVLNNMRIGIRASLNVLKAGFAPFTPWFDYQFQLVLYPGEHLEIEDYYNYSMAWLRASDAVYVCNLREGSKGTQAEIDEARRLNIPIYFSLQDLIDAEG